MIFLVLGDDKICRAFVRDNVVPESVKLIRDKSSAGIGRILRLVRKGVLTPKQVVQIALAETSRARAPAYSAEEVSSSNELLKLVETYSPSKIILFRAGLIVNGKLLSSGLPIWNLHAAKIPEYGGLASISRALRDRAFHQCATLHVVTSRIDDGEVLDTEPYTLSADRSYAANEAVAYAAGSRLLRRTLDRRLRQS
ncbi:formyltransferase family protein [Afipia sp. P52-10]|uniref:formyltransferase family protein n=1 Tax=Afipia sp. P52-10 TaxID=1429916 RepID=UPI0009DCAB64